MQIARLIPSESRQLYSWPLCIAKVIICSRDASKIFQSWNQVLGLWYFILIIYRAACDLLNLLNNRKGVFWSILQRVKRPSSKYRSFDCTIVIGRRASKEASTMVFPLRPSPLSPPANSQNLLSCMSSQHI